MGRPALVFSRSFPQLLLRPLLLESLGSGWVYVVFLQSRRH